MISTQGNGSFTGQLESHAFAGFVIVFDGTLINNTDAVTELWQNAVNSLSLCPSIRIRLIFRDSKDLLSYLGKQNRRRAGSGSSCHPAQFVRPPLQQYSATVRSLRSKLGMSVNLSRIAITPIVDTLATDIRHTESLVPKSYDSTANNLRGVEFLVAASALWQLSLPARTLMSGWLELLRFTSPPGFGCRAKCHSRQAGARLLQPWLRASTRSRAGPNAWC